jgi:hypothetical protein
MKELTKVSKKKRRSLQKSRLAPSFERERTVETDPLDSMSFFL